MVDTSSYVTGSYFDVMLANAAVGMTGQFFSVSGLSMEQDYEMFTEGGSNYPRYYQKGAKPQTLVLEQGTVTTVDALAIMMQYTNVGMGIPLTGVITLKDYKGTPMRTWTIVGAYMTKYEGPSLDSNNAALAVTRMEFVYGGCG